MFRNKKLCEDCLESYDALEYECPKCHKKNHDIEGKGISRHIAVTPIWVQIVLFAIGFIGLQIIALIVQIAFLMFKPEDISTSEYLYLPQILGPSQFIAYGLLFFAFLAFIILYHNQFFKGWKDWKTYVSAIVGIHALLGFSMIYGLILNFFFQTSGNQNEGLIKIIVGNYPFLSILILGIVGPLCEELTYRVGFFTFLRRIHPALAYTLTILLFAFIHFDVSSFMTAFKGNWTPLVNELANIPSYLFAAAVLTVLYEKFGFASAFMAHASNNLISIVISIIALSYGTGS